MYRREIYGTVTKEIKKYRLNKFCFPTWECKKNVQSPETKSHSGRISHIKEKEKKSNLIMKDV